MFPGILEFSIGGPAKAAANDLTGVAETKTAECGPHDLVASKPRERGFMVAAHGSAHPKSLCCMEAKLVQPISISASSHPVVHDSAAANVAAAYNQAGGDYVAYADGDPTHLFAFNGLHAYADRRIWTILEAKMMHLRATGANSISILDAGCGPGTWLRRLVTRAHVLGFTTITARGFCHARPRVQVPTGAIAGSGIFPEFQA